MSYGLPLGPLERFRDLIVATVNPPRPKPGTIRLFAKSDGIYFENSSGVVASATLPITWTAATSMPGSPTTNQRVTRTDLGLDFFWNGTRWLSTQLFREGIMRSDTLNPVSANSTTLRGPMWSGDYDLWVETIYAWAYVLTTNDGSKYWTVTLLRNPSGTTIGSFTTAADTVTTHTGHKVTVGALTGTSDREWEVLVAKTSTPGNIYVGLEVAYRLVGT